MFVSITHFGHSQEGVPVTRTVRIHTSSLTRKPFQLRWIGDRVSSSSYQLSIMRGEVSSISSVEVTVTYKAPKPEKSSITLGCYLGEVEATRTHLRARTMQPKVTVASHFLIVLTVLLDLLE